MNKPLRDNVTIAYIGGGSKGWAWGLMTDLAKESSFCGTVKLYDINHDASKANAIIGNRIKEDNKGVTPWQYEACETLEESLTGADFVIISILPGNFDDMATDVHAPETYGIYQSVGDTVGPGGLMRALRTIPMYVTIAEAIKKYAPEAWVLNYTNPMTICTRTLYKVFPQIKAFGNCHEVFNTQQILSRALYDMNGIPDVPREAIKVSVAGINHFTWITSASYKDIDLYRLYTEFVDKYYKDGFNYDNEDNWMNNHFKSANRVKFDLFKRYGVIAAAGDRHLAEFCPSHWYLGSEDNVKKWMFRLTPVAWRKENEVTLRDKSRKLIAGKIPFELKETGEEGVRQMKALLGLEDLVTNVNMPNQGQIPWLDNDLVVETNALIRHNQVVPMVAEPLPPAVKSMIINHANNQEMIVEASLTGNKALALNAFVNDPLVTVTTEEATALFDTMCHAHALF